MLNHNILITLSYQLYMIFNDNILDILKVFQRNKTPETLGKGKTSTLYHIYNIYEGFELRNKSKLPSLPLKKINMNDKIMT